MSRKPRMKQRIVRLTYGMTSGGQSVVVGTVGGSVRCNASADFKVSLDAISSCCAIVSL